MRKNNMFALSEQIYRHSGSKTQAELAELCDISVRHFSSILCQRTTVTAETLIKLRKGIHIDLNQWADTVIELNEREETMS